MKRTLTILAVVAVVAVSCTLTPDQRQVVDSLRDDGIITPEQHAAIVGGTWDAIKQWLIYAGSAAFTAYTGIRLHRGPAATSEERAARKAAKKPPKPQSS